MLPGFQQWVGDRFSMLASAPLLAGLMLGSAGCQATDSSNRPAPRVIYGTGTSAGAAEGGRALAFVAGDAVFTTELMPMLIESTGGQVFSELVLEKLIDDRLAADGRAITEAQLEHERQLLAENLSDNPDEAARLLRELRRRRGLGEARFRSLLRRNAGLRQMVQPRVQITRAGLEQAYHLKYGPTYQARLIVVPSQYQARRIVEQLAGGEDFAALAAEHSTDASRAQGGLLPPINPRDPGFPEVIRSALPRLGPMEVSQIIAVEGGFAILRLEKMTPGAEVAFEDVRSELSRATRLQLERILMQQAARALISGAEVIVLDPVLEAGWQEQKTSLLSPQ